ncbi:MAG: hypothetical protein BroJett039_13460 [Chloroflexota bacterium]|nr:MAG: hypothetical protein BroJett039_13460 [Chloroflexota bacterium]
MLRIGCHREPYLYLRPMQFIGAISMPNMTQYIAISPFNASGHAFWTRLSRIHADL